MAVPDDDGAGTSGTGGQGASNGSVNGGRGTGGQGGAGDADGDGEPYDQQRAMATIQKLRQEAKEGKTSKARLAEVEAELKRLQDAQLTADEKKDRELEQLRKEKEEWENERRTARIERAALTAADKAGALVPEAVFALMDRSSVEIDAKGKITGLEEAVLAVKESHPRLFGAAGSANGGAGNNSGDAGENDMNARLRAAIRGR